MEAIIRSESKVPFRFNLSLGVVTHVPHWMGPDGAIWAYEPYVREIRLWADLFSQVEISAPRADARPEGSQACYDRQNVTWRPFNYSMSYSRWAPLRRLSQLPIVAQNVHRLVRRSDLVHLRSPGHPALVGHFLVRLMNKRSITKWAGFFGPFEGERLPSRVERRLVKWAPHRHPTLIYGTSNDDGFVPFLPALMSNQEISRAQELARLRRWTRPWKLLSVGRLLRVKGFDLAIRGLGELKQMASNLEWEYTIIGDGPALEELEALAKSVGIQSHVRFEGALSFADVQRHYGQAHVAIMPGTKEGWPKVIAEAWAHGAVPAAAAAGLVPSIMRGETSGIVFEPNATALATALAALLNSPERLRYLSRRVVKEAESLSLECFKARLEQVLIDRCGLL